MKRNSSENCELYISLSKGERGTRATGNQERSLVDFRKKKNDARGPPSAILAGQTVASAATLFIRGVFGREGLEREIERFSYR